METGNETIVVDVQEISSSLKNLELTSSIHNPSQTDDRENKSAKEMQREEADQQDDTDFGLMNDFPSEMLTQILKNLDAPTLFACRLMNWQWNAIASEILCRKAEVEIKFSSRDEELSTRKHGEENSLQDFVECMKRSRNCPFVRFSFDVSSPTLGEFNCFLFDFDVERIKCLKLSWRFGGDSFFRTLTGGAMSMWGPRDVGVQDKDEEITAFFNLTKNLGDLLLNKVPHLEEFGLELPDRGIKEPQPKLFSKSASTSNSSPIQLDHLKVVHLGCLTFSKYPGIMRDLLSAAVNLEKIEPFSDYALPHLRASDFHFLDSIGKLECIKNVLIAPSPKFIRNIKKKMPSLPHLLKLSKLELSCLHFFNCDPSYFPDIANFLSALFDSSKNTLTSLRMGQLGFLHRLQLPRFTNLLELILHQTFDDGEDFEGYPLFPPEIKSMDIFPTVRSLKYQIDHWDVPYPGEDSFPDLPAVETIQLKIHSGLDVQRRIEYLGSLCPNVRHFKITRHDQDGMPYLDFLQVGRTIWTHMPKLESLKLFVNLGSEENDPVDPATSCFELSDDDDPQDPCVTEFSESNALDSAFTGFSEETCKRLSELVEAKLEKQTGDFDVKVLEAESELELGQELKREHPSIFDMKDLKKLTVNPFSPHGDRLARKAFIQKLTWISEKYTLKLMPQLVITEDDDE